MNPVVSAAIIGKDTAKKELNWKIEGSNESYGPLVDSLQIAQKEINENLTLLVEKEKLNPVAIASVAKQHISVEQASEVPEPELKKIKV
ncbi:hypothetical protein HDE_04685 [Halotydeus destructor]|nr:hypothetical protein HDE_04685 [Halotydeus destructor]